MLKELKAEIKEKLETLTGTDKPFVSVYDYHTLNNVWFPYLTFENESFDSQIIDNCTNKVNYTFNIFIYQAENDDREGAVNILVQAHDDLVNMINKDYTIWGVANAGVALSSWEWGQLTGWNGNTLVHTVRLTCSVIQSIV